MAAAASTVEGLLALHPSEFGPVAARLRARRNDQPLMLALTEAAGNDSPRQALRHVWHSLVDTTWVEETAGQVAAYPSAGVLAVGSATRSVLEAAAMTGRELRSLFTDQRAVAVGLGYLPLEIVGAAPEAAAVLLVPAVAIQGERLWTSAYAADVAKQAVAAATPLLVLAHPLCHLSPASRRAYRPPPFIVDWRR